MTVYSASSSARKVLQYINFYLIVDITKIVVALWLLAVMLCVARENYAWSHAINEVRSVIEQQDSFIDNMDIYTQIGNDWRTLSEVLAMTKPVTDATTNLRSVPLLLSAVNLFVPRTEEIIIFADETGKRLNIIQSELDGLSHMHAAGSYANVLVTHPNKDNLLGFASICENQLVALDLIAKDLEPLLFVVDHGISILNGVENLFPESSPIRLIPGVPAIFKWIDQVSLQVQQKKFRWKTLTFGLGQT